MPLDDQRSSPLHVAAAYGRLKIVKALLARGASPECRDVSGETPLMRAIGRSTCYEMDVFPFLLHLLRRSVFARDDAGRTILHHAAFLSQYPSKRVLSRYYTQCILDYADHAMSASTAVTQDTVESFMNAKDEHGRTALHVAAFYRNHRVVQMLLGYGADPLLEDAYGDTPIE
ncbi:ankyrin repeat-containing domain protein, partial [Entophlyctis helioformis]